MPEKTKQISGILTPCLFYRPSSFVKWKAENISIPEEKMEFFYLVSLYCLTEPPKKRKKNNQYFMARFVIVERNSQIEPIINEMLFEVEDKAGTFAFTSAPSRLFNKHEVDVFMPEKENITNIPEYEKKIHTLWPVKTLN